MAVLPATGDLADGTYYEIIDDGLDLCDPDGELLDSMAFEDMQDVEHRGSDVVITALGGMRYQMRLFDEVGAYALDMALHVALARLDYIPDILVRVEIYRNPKEYRQEAPAMARAGWRVVDVSDATSHGGCLSFVMLGWLGVLMMKKRSVAVTYEASLRAHTVEGWGSPRQRLRSARRARRRLPSRNERDR